MHSLDIHVVILGLLFVVSVVLLVIWAPISAYLLVKKRNQNQELLQQIESLKADISDLNQVVNYFSR